MTTLQTASPVSLTSNCNAATTALIHLVRKLVDELKSQDHSVDLGTMLVGSAVTFRFHGSGEFSLDVDINSPAIQQDHLRDAVETILKGQSNDADGPDDTWPSNYP